LNDEEKKGVLKIISGLINPQSYPAVTLWVAQGVTYTEQRTDTTTKECNHWGQFLCDQLTSVNEYGLPAGSGARVLLLFGDDRNLAYLHVRTRNGVELRDEKYHASGLISLVGLFRHS